MKNSEKSEKTLLVSEIFSSLQGEGPFIGLPAWFIRLAGCVEPRCPWCDTPYALDGGLELSIPEILAVLKADRANLAVVTGGEPFAQWDKGLSGLHEKLLEKGFSVQYETSGKAGIPGLTGAFVVCSPKFAGGSWQFDPADAGRVDLFKFVAGSPEDFREIEAFVARLGISRDRVCIMPLGATREEQLRGMEAVFTFCAEKGYRMSPRLHVLTFDTRRGL